MGAFMQRHVRPLYAQIAHALFMDMTHDNQCPIQVGCSCEGCLVVAVWFGYLYPLPNDFGLDSTTPAVVGTGIWSGLHRYGTTRRFSGVQVYRGLPWSPIPDLSRGGGYVDLRQKKIQIGGVCRPGKKVATFPRDVQKWHL